MAAKAEDPPALSDPASETPPPPRAAAGLFDKRSEKFGGEEKDRGRDEELEEEPREAKRRRTTRQLALEKPPPPESAGRGIDGPAAAEFSFSFDTRISTPIETTPKFGSFNLSLDLGGVENDEDDAAGEKVEAEEREDGEGK